MSNMKRERREDFETRQHRYNEKLRQQATDRGRTLDTPTPIATRRKRGEFRSEEEIVRRKETGR